MDPDLPVAKVRLLEDVVGDSIAEPRFTMQLLLLFGALVLAAVGIYGVWPSRWRCAATRWRCGWRWGPNRGGWGGTGWRRRPPAWPWARCCALGCAGAALRNGRDGPGDVPGGGLASVAVAALASYIPARRTARVDPAVTLRRG